MSELVIAARYTEDSRADTFVDVEVASEGEIDLIVNPRTEDSQTFSMDIEETWKLIRRLALAAATVESDDEA